MVIVFDHRFYFLFENHMFASPTKYDFSSILININGTSIMNNRLCPWLRFSDSTKSNPLRAYDNSMRPLIDYIDLLNLLIQIHLINVLENFMMNSFVVVNIHVTDIFLHSLVPLYWCCGWYGWCGCVYAWLSIGCITYSIWNKHWNLKLFHVTTTKKNNKKSPSCRSEYLLKAHSDTHMRALTHTPSTRWLNGKTPVKMKWNGEHFSIWHRQIRWWCNNCVTF